MARKQKLTKQQRLFVDYYIELGSTEPAAIKAGYSKTYAKSQSYKLLDNVGVKTAIDKKMAEKESKLIASQDEVLKHLTAVMRGESYSEIVVVEGCGDGCSSARRVKKLPDEKDQLKAAELLGKRYGIFTDKVNIEGAVPVQIFDGVERDGKD